MGDGPKADVADFMLRMIQHPETVGRKPTPKPPQPINAILNDMIKRNPLVKTLIERLDLTPE